MTTHIWGTSKPDDDGIIYWTTSSYEGWKVEERDDRYAVYWHTNEVMRLSADGMLGFGKPEPYWFKTLEWALLCKQRLQSLDRAFQRYGSAAMTLDASGPITLDTVSPAFKLSVSSQHKPIVTVSDGGVTHVDVPTIVGIWWRNTTVYRAWRKLMWGEKA